MVTIPPSLQPPQPQVLQKPPTVQEMRMARQPVPTTALPEDLSTEINNIINRIEQGEITSEAQIPQEYRQFIELPEGYFQQAKEYRQKISKYQTEQNKYAEAMKEIAEWRQVYDMWFKKETGVGDATTVWGMELYYGTPSMKRKMRAFDTAKAHQKKLAEQKIAEQQARVEEASKTISIIETEKPTTPSFGLPTPAAQEVFGVIEQTPSLYTPPIISVDVPRRETIAPDVPGISDVALGQVGVPEYLKQTPAEAVAKLPPAEKDVQVFTPPSWLEPSPVFGMPIPTPYPRYYYEKERVKERIAGTPLAFPAGVASATLLLPVEFTGQVVRHPYQTARGLTDVKGMVKEMGVQYALYPEYATGYTVGMLFGGKYTPRVAAKIPKVVPKISAAAKESMAKFLASQKELLRDTRAMAGRTKKKQKMETLQYKRKFTADEIVGRTEDSFKKGTLKEDLNKWSRELTDKKAREGFGKYLKELERRGLIKEGYLYDPNTGQLSFYQEFRSIQWESPIRTREVVKELPEPKEFGLPPLQVKEKEVTLYPFGKRERVKDKDVIVFAEPTITKEKEVVDSASKLLTGVSTAQRLVQPQITKQPLATGLMSAQTLVQPTLQKEITKQKFETPQVYGFETPTPTRVRPPRKPKRPSIRIPFEFPDESYLRGERIGYDVLVKDKGKYHKVNDAIYNRQGAKDLGARYVDNTTAATFKIEPIKQTDVVKGKKVEKTKLFKRGKLKKGDGYFNSVLNKIRGHVIKNGRPVQVTNMWIERHGYRADTRGEQKGLSVAKYKAQYTKRKRTNKGGNVRNLFGIK